MGKLTDEQRTELAELRARNLQELQALKEDMAQRAKVIRLSDHRKPEPEVKTVTTFTDYQIKQMVEALREETRVQLEEHHGFLKALISEAYSDLYRSTKTMRKEIQRLRDELAELRGAETKAVEAGGVVTPIVRKERAR